VSDPFDLARFVEAQGDGTYEQALGELRAGHKTTHWMWFVLPQLAGLGHSPMAVRFALSSLDGARAYLRHPVLGPRLRECAQALLAVPDRSAVDVLGEVDARKLQSSMTLFARAEPDEPVFTDVLDRFFAGRPDAATTSRL
jgi:uncharacterized protein (DUF1810 family)